MISICIVIRCYCKDIKHLEELAWDRIWTYFVNLEAMEECWHAERMNALKHIRSCSAQQIPQVLLIERTCSNILCRDWRDDSELVQKPDNPTPIPGIHVKSLIWLYASVIRVLLKQDASRDKRVTQKAKSRIVSNRQFTKAADNTENCWHWAGRNTWALVLAEAALESCPLILSKHAVPGLGPLPK